MDINLLKKIHIFSDLSSAAVEELLARSQKRRYPQGNIVLHKDDAGDMIYLILKGKVKVVLTHSDGRETILTILKSGDYFGEMSVFDYMPRSATIVTEEDCEFLIISREAITGLIKRSPEIALKLLSEMSRRVREANEQIDCLVNLDARGRVAQTLLKLSKGADAIIEKDHRVIPKPLMRDIAAMSGTSRETVSRILNELTKRGIIGLTKECIIIYERLETDDDIR